MRSASSSDRGGRRNLAVYRVPAPPPGWEGHDLVRIVDALGLGAAWLDARRLGSVVALHQRTDPDDPWTSAAGGDGQWIVTIGRDGDRSELRQRDPVAAAFSAFDTDASSRLNFEDGLLRIETSADIDCDAAVGAVSEGVEGSTGMRRWALTVIGAAFAEGGPSPRVSG